MAATFVDMAKQIAGASDDAPRTKVQLGARVDPVLKAPLEDFGQRLRELGVSSYGTGGASNALEAILEMAAYLEWFDNPETFAAELLRRRADALEKRHAASKKK